MRFERILLATDFSTDADHAAEVALGLARAVGGAIELVHAYAGPALVMPDGSAFPPGPDELLVATTRAEAALAEAIHRLQARAPGVTITGQARYGLPVDEILRLAASGRFDVIVMGTHGRTGLRRLFAGSVAEAVIRRAPIPVLAVRMPDQAHAQPAELAAAQARP